jgi:hypothetical protein
MDPKPTARPARRHLETAAADARLGNRPILHAVAGAPLTARATLGGGWERELDIGRSPPNGAIAYVALQ